MADNSRKFRILSALSSRTAAVTGVFLFVSWALVSARAFYASDFESFQRAGVLAQASALLLFTATLARVIPSEDLIHKFQQRYEKLGKNGFRELISDIGDDEFRDKLLRRLEREGGIGPFLTRLKAIALSTEISVLLIGTLQTGYGDWFACSLKEMRLSKC
jgi:hypothetical protein